MQTDVLIVGGGLSGLHTAYELHKRGIDFILVEARNRFGGRILSENIGTGKYDSSKPAFDLGPSWFWPGQIYMQELIEEVGLSEDVYMQAGEGDALFEDNQGNIQRGISGISMAGAYRLQGGIRKLTTRLAESMPTDVLLKDSTVTEVEFQQDKIISTLSSNGSANKVLSKHVVLALPPRVALASINFTPKFPQQREDELNAVSTWMAGHAKLVVTYKKRFWNESGLSGDVISHKGPLQEIHDASSKDGMLCALFGFFSVQAQYRKAREEELRQMAIAQLTRLFGEQASSPIEMNFKDWAFDSHTATEQDQKILKFHPANDIGSFTEELWQQRLIWSGSESADYRQHNNGFLEGAVEASMRTVKQLTA